MALLIYRFPFPFRPFFQSPSWLYFHSHADQYCIFRSFFLFPYQLHFHSRADYFKYYTTTVHLSNLVQGNIRDPEVSLGVNGKSVGHVELRLTPGTLRSTNTRELEQRWNFDRTVSLTLVGEVKVE